MREGQSKCLAASLVHRVSEGQMALIAVCPIRRPGGSVRLPSSLLPLAEGSLWPLRQSMQSELNEISRKKGDGEEDVWAGAVLLQMMWWVVKNSRSPEWSRADKKNMWIRQSLDGNSKHIEQTRKGRNRLRTESYTEFSFTLLISNSSHQFIHSFQGLSCLAMGRELSGSVLPSSSVEAMTHRFPSFFKN